MEKNANFNKKMLKKSPEELEQYLHFKSRGSATKSKKGKGSYTRKTKHKKDMYD